MENRRQKSSSGDKFSFPIIMPVHEQDGEFEFRCVSTSPGSPNSPADRLFFNGKLLPHDFPCQPATGFSYSRSTSRASSVSSKDSLMSSRCNSSNSSRCSSARTSTSESSERKLATKNIRYHMMKNRAIPSSQNLSASQRWQFMATPALVDLRNKQRHVSGASQKGRNQELKIRKQGGDDDEELINKTAGKSSARFGLRILRSFVSTCKECHAIQPSNRETIV